MDEKIVNNGIIIAPEDEDLSNNSESQEQIPTQKSIINKLIANGCKKIESLHVKNTNYTEKDNYTQIVFTIKEQIEGYVGEDGVFTLGKVNTIFSSTFALAAVLKENEETAWIAKPLIDNPKMAGLIFSGATITIIQQNIAAGVEYNNPFTTIKDAESTFFDHDTIINHVVSIKFGKVGEKMLDKLADKMLGF